MATPNRFLDEIRAKVSEVIASSPAKDVERNVKAMVSSAATRLDLVTREEFDIQAKVLERTREKVAELERKVAELEALLAERASKT